MDLPADLQPLEVRRFVYMCLAALTFVYGCYVVYHWDFRVIRPIIKGVGEFGFWGYLFGKGGGE